MARGGESEANRLEATARVLGGWRWVSGAAMLARDRAWVASSRSKGADMDGTTVIRGGTVVDGTGAPARAADVAIADGREVEVGSNLRGDHELDASGHVVAPGFIDIHTHY